MVEEIARKGRLKQIFPKRDTKIEILLDVFLNELNIKKDRDYRTHVSILNLCQPDKVFFKQKVVVFCDGDYWHNLPNYKIRDEKQNKILKENSWIVLRFWEHEINNNPKECALKIKEILEHGKLD
jgi:very-short-patch-repair endonuclease